MPSKPMTPKERELAIRVQIRDERERALAAPFVQGAQEYNIRLRAQSKLTGSPVFTRDLALAPSFRTTGGACDDSKSQKTILKAIEAADRACELARLTTAAKHAASCKERRAARKVLHDRYIREV